MSILQDINFWAFVVMVAGLLINWLASQKIATNHLFHMDKKLDKIDGNIETIKKKINEHDTDIAVLKEKSKVRSRKRNTK